MVRTDGFIRNVHSRNPFDVIRADVVLMRMEKEAGRGCGMNFELYQARVLRDALDYLAAAAERASGTHGSSGKTWLQPDTGRRRARTGSKRCATGRTEREVLRPAKYLFLLPPITFLIR